MIKWENLPERIKNEKTYPYYELLQQKKIQILWKRVLDFLCGCFDCTPISGDAADCSGH